MALKLALLHGLITGDSSDYVAATKTAEAATTKFQGSVKGLSTHTSKAFGSIGKFAKSNDARMLSMQFSQVAQMASATGQPLRALAIQLPDIGLAFGTVGIAAGILAGTALPVLMSAFGATGDKAEELKGALESLKEAHDDLDKLNEIALSTLDELTERYGSYAESVRDAARALLELRVSEVQRELSEQLDLLDDVARRYATLSDHVGEFNDISLRNIENELGLVGAEAERVSILFDQFLSAETAEAQQEVLARINDTLGEMGVKMSDYPDLLREAVGAMLELKIASAETAAEVERAQVAMAGLTSGVGLTGETFRLPTEAEMGLPAAPAAVGGGSRGRSGGGGRAQADPFEQRLERLREQFMTEAELELKHYQDQQLMLDEALAAKALSQEEYYSLSESMAKDHASKMAAIDAYRYGDGTQKMAAFLGDMANAFANGNERMMQIGKAFGAAEALVNAWRAYSQAMADPSLPWYAKLGAAMNLLSSGMQAVNAIKSVGKGGSGQRSAGGTAGSIEASGQAAAPTMNRSLTLIGDNFNRQQAVQIAEFLNEGSDDGLIVRGR